MSKKSSPALVIPEATSLSAKVIFGDHNEASFQFPLRLTDAQMRQEAKKRYRKVLFLSVFPTGEEERVLIDTRIKALPVKA